MDKEKNIHSYIFYLSMIALLLFVVYMSTKDNKDEIGKNASVNPTKIYIQITKINGSYAINITDANITINSSNLTKILNSSNVTILK